MKTYFLLIFHGFYAKIPKHGVKKVQNGAERAQKLSWRPPGGSWGPPGGQKCDFVPFFGTLLGPKMGLKWTRGALGGSLGRPGGPRGGSGGPLGALGSPREAPWGLWGLKQIIENPLCFIIFLQYGGFRGSLGRPRGAQRDRRGGRGGPRGAQGRPEGGPGGSKGRLWRRPKTVRKTEAAVFVVMGSAAVTRDPAEG